MIGYQNINNISWVEVWVPMPNHLPEYTKVDKKQKKVFVDNGRKKHTKIAHTVGNNHKYQKLYFFLHICSTWVKIRWHNDNQLPGCPKSG